MTKGQRDLDTRGQRVTKQPAFARLLLVAAAVLLGVLCIVSYRPLQTAWRTNVVALRVLKETATQADGWPSSSSDWLEAVVQSVPDATGPARLGGYYYLRRGRTVDAARLLERVASRDSLAAFWSGATYDSEGRHDEAISAYRQAGAATYFLERGHDPYAAGDYESACSSYLRGIRDLRRDGAGPNVYGALPYAPRGVFAGRSELSSSYSA